MITMKFGGTSVRDADAIANIVRIIRRSLDRHPVVVISAIAQATNILEQIGRSAERGDGGGAADLIGSLMERHRTIASELFPEGSRKEHITFFLGEIEETLRTLVRGISTLKELTPRSLDALCSQGELMSSKIVAEILGEEGIPSEWIDTKDFLITDDIHTRARPRLSVVEDRLKKVIQPMLAAGGVPVTQGYIGSTSDGVRTTMGRESSDYTGALIGGLLGADIIEIWTDVSGVRTADPRIVPEAKRIDHLSFGEAFRLTYYGAKVLHPKTMEPARVYNIPIHILNSGEPDLPGTIISSDPDPAVPGVKSVTSQCDVGILTLTPREKYDQKIFRDHVHGVVMENRLEALLTASSESHVVLVCKSVEISPIVMKSFEDVCDTAFIAGKGMLCLVGSNIMRTPHLVERTFRAVGDIPSYFVETGSSGDVFGIVVDDVEVNDAVRRVHAEFFQ